MADDDLIDTYLHDLQATMRWHRDATGIVAEAADHLRSAVDRLMASGVEVEEAQRRALQRFGDPVIVARSHALTRGGRLAIPTRSTKEAGAHGPSLPRQCWRPLVASAMLAAPRCLGNAGGNLP